MNIYNKIPENIALNIRIKMKCIKELKWFDLSNDGQLMVELGYE